jgi:hypothetical protein
MTRLFAAVHESGSGTKLPNRDVRCLVAIGGKQTSGGRPIPVEIYPSRTLATHCGRASRSRIRVQHALVSPTNVRPRQREPPGGNDYAIQFSLAAVWDRRVRHQKR